MWVLVRNSICKKRVFDIREHFLHFKIKHSITYKTNPYPKISISCLYTTLWGGGHWTLFDFITVFTEVGDVVHMRLHFGLSSILTHSRVLLFQILARKNMKMKTMLKIMKILRVLRDIHNIQPKYYCHFLIFERIKRNKLGLS